MHNWEISKEARQDLGEKAGRKERHELFLTLQHFSAGARMPSCLEQRLSSSLLHTAPLKNKFSKKVRGASTPPYPGKGLKSILMELHKPTALVSSHRMDKVHLTHCLPLPLLFIWVSCHADRSFPQCHCPSGLHLLLLPLFILHPLTS